MIDSDKYYNLQKIVSDGYIPWIKSTPTMKRFVLKHRAILNPLISGTGRGHRYLIKGSAITNLLALAESGQLNSYIDNA